MLSCGKPQSFAVNEWLDANLPSPLTGRLGFDAEIKLPVCQLILRSSEALGKSG